MVLWFISFSAWWSSQSLLLTITVFLIPKLLSCQNCLPEFILHARTDWYQKLGSTMLTWSLTNVRGVLTKSCNHWVSLTNKRVRLPKMFLLHLMKCDINQNWAIAEAPTEEQKKTVCNFNWLIAIGASWDLFNCCFVRQKIRH